jgi:hypothetical protein
MDLSNLTAFIVGIILVGAWIVLWLLPPNLWFTKKFPFVERRPRIVWQRDYSPEFIKKMIDSGKWEVGTGKGTDGLRYPVLIEVLNVRDK